MSTSDERFDAAIDRAVREIMDVEPPADLRARVIERIDRRASPFMRWTMRAAVPAAAAALVIVWLAVWLSLRQAPVVQTAHVQHAPEVVPREPARAGAVAREVPPVDVAHIVPARSRRGSGVHMVLAIDSSAPAVSSVAPLDPIAPIRVPAMASSDITPQAISIEPLARIAQVQIAPLTPPDGRH